MIPLTFRDSENIVFVCVLQKDNLGIIIAADDKKR